MRLDPYAFLPEYQAPVQAAQHVKIGRALRRELERIAPALGYDATGLARVVLREYVELHDRGEGYGPPAA